MRKQFILCILSVMTFCAFASFTDINAGLQGLNYSSAEWGDFNNDGLLDVVVTGNTGSGQLTTVYHNNYGIFMDFSPGMQGVQNGDAEWGDYDNDGDLDVLIVGSGQSGPVARIYQSDGVFMFTDIFANLEGVSNASAEWVDYDNDGDLDAFICGATDIGEFISKIYKNVNGTFCDSGIQLEGVMNGASAWGDYDNDGDPDLLLNGADYYTGPISKLYRNDNNTFTEMITPFSGVQFSSAAWGDYDSDGDMDLIITGDFTTRIYRNDNYGNFMEIMPLADQVIAGSGEWGDYDNDGDLDILLTGYNGSTPVCKVYSNTGFDTFTDSGFVLPGVYEGHASWGDYDNDGDLDILLTGDTGAGYITSIFANDNPVPNNPPMEVFNLFSQVGQDSVLLSWDKSIDMETPQNGLSYNIYLGSGQFTTDKLDPMSQFPGGWRKIPASGNAGPNNYIVLRDLAPGTYYWGVQAVDNGFIGSSFMEEGVFTYEGKYSEIQNGLEFAQCTITVFGDYDADGDLDVLAASEGQTTVFENFEGTYYPAPADLADVNSGTADWIDFDNDGDLDILVTGQDQMYSMAVTKLYRNDGAGMFSEVNSGLPNVRCGAVDVGDFDNDGDADLLITGYQEDYEYIGRISKLYDNCNGIFTEFGTNFVSVDNGDAVLADLDCDGDLDVFVSGDTGSGFETKIYSNMIGMEFPEDFMDISAGLDGVMLPSAAVGDYDNDGDPDILITSMYPEYVRLYNYDSDMHIYNDTFLEIASFDDCTASWGDIDNDGDLDILMNGTYWDGDAVYSTKIYLNQWDGFTTSFSEMNTQLEGVSGSSSLGDYDSDGDLDILVAGYNDEGLVSKFYRNNSMTPNEVPSQPENPYAYLNGDYMEFHWDKSTDIETPQDGLSYNIYIGSEPFTGDAMDPMSDCMTGRRRIVRTGNSGQSGMWKINDLPTGDYYWSVQAVDHNFAGSPFAYEMMFHYEGDFTEVATEIHDLEWGSVSFGDLDNDHDLDLIAAGTGTTGLYVNECQFDSLHPFWTVPSGLPNLDYEAVTEWGDFDNDGDLDLFLSGRYYDGSEHKISEIYINGSATFTPLNAGLPYLNDPAAGWFDYDNDGDLDLAVCGYCDSLSERFTKVYRNDTGVFTDIYADITGVSEGDLSWAKDPNGYSILFVSGISQLGGPSAAIYFYDPLWDMFVDSATPMTGVFFGSSVFGDFDGNGFVDLIYCGRNMSSSIQTYLFQNNGFMFEDIIMIDPLFDLPDADMGDLYCGDIDNDGDLDLLITGNTDGSAFPGGGVPFTQLLENRSAPFMFLFNPISTGIEDVYLSSTSMGDYDADGDMDILISGNNGTFPVTKLYKNNNTPHNIDPLPPEMMNSTPGIDYVSLDWGDGIDDTTTSEALTYNIYIRSASDSSLVVGPMSDVISGTRMIVAAGNNGQNNSVTIYGLQKGDYLWSVQSVDNSFAASSFAIESMFTIEGLQYPDNVLVEIVGDNVKVSWDAVPDANQYKIFTSDDPYCNFTDVTSEGFFKDNTWTVMMSDDRMFFYVVASTEMPVK